MEVISPFIGTPAFRAGIQIGDILTKVDGEDILNLTATETSKKLKGDPGTKVKVDGEELLVMKESDILAVLEG